MDSRDFTLEEVHQGLAAPVVRENDKERIKNIFYLFVWIDNSPQG